MATGESNTTRSTSGRIAMLREWRAPGRDTHRNVAYPSCANHTGEAHGVPAPSAVASVMYALASMMARAPAGVVSRCTALRSVLRGDLVGDDVHLGLEAGGRGVGVARLGAGEGHLEHGAAGAARAVERLDDGGAAARAVERQGLG